jgi:TP901 family phage tail tape measure protein
MDGLKVFIGGDAAALKKTLREADYAIKGFVNQNKGALKSLEKLGAPAAIALTGLTLSIGAAAKKFGDFEATLNRVQAVSNASASEMAALKVKAEELGAATKFSGQEAASGMEELAKAGFNAKQTMDAIPGVLQLAAAGGVSVAQAAELAGGTIRGFGLAMDEAGRVADVMAQAANQSSVDIGDLQLTMKYVAPVASSASQSLEEMSGAIAIMGNSMIKGEQAGTTLRAALTRLQDPPKEAGEQLSALGIAISDTQGRMLPLGDIVDQLRTKTAKMTEVQRNAAIAQIFGTEALSGMLTLVKASPAEYQAMVDSMRNADGAAKKMSDTINSGFNGAMDQLGASVDSAVKAVGENLAPSILALAGGIKSAADAFNGMDPALKTMTVGAAAGGTALLGMVAAAGLLLPALASVRTALFAMNTLALTPVGATIAALALTVGVATMAFKAHSDAVNAAKNKEIEAKEARIKSTATVKAQKDELEKLAKEYHNLAGKSKLSKDEQERLKAIQDKLAKEYPAIAEVIAKGATSHDKVEAAVRREIAAKADLLKMDQVAAQQRVMSDATQLANERRKLDELQQRLEDAKSAPSYGDSAGKVQELNVISGMIAAQQRAVDAVNARVLASAADLQRVNGIVIPKPAAAKPNRGNAYSGGEGKSGKTEAEKAAEEAHRLQVEALGKLSAAYQRNLQVAQAWGGGTAAEVESLTGLIAEVRTKGLDTIPEGYEAIVNAETRLKAIQGERAVAGKKANEELTKTIEEGATETAGMVSGFQALFALMGPLNKQMDDFLDAKDAAAFNATIRDMQGELMAMATDPSLERMANFTKEIVKDTSRLASWGKTLGDVGDAYKKAGGGADGFAAAITKLGGGGLDTVSLAVSATVGVVGMLKNAFDEAAAAQARLKASSESTAAELRKLNAELSGDPVLIAEAERQGKRADLEADLKRRLEQRRADLRASDPTLMFKDFMMNGAASQRIDGMGLADFPDLDAWYKAQLALLDKGPGGAVGSDEAIARMAGNAEQDQQRIEAAFESYEAMVDRLGEINEELTEGGRDAFGRKITLELERQQKVLEQQEENAKRLNALSDRKLKLETDLRQLKIDEAKAIADIENEGIAVRALTEAQDKGVRIERVKADYAKKRLDITDEITRVNGDITQATLEAEQAMMRINIQYEERFAALEQEAAKLTANVAIAQQQLGIERSITDEIKRRQAIQSGGGSSSSSTPSQRSTPGAATGNTTYRQQYFHTGGTVPLKPDERPAILRANEFVFTPQQFQGLIALRAAAASSRGGGYGTGDVHITVNAAPGMSERRVADYVWNDFSSRLRRSGLGR